MTEKEAWALDEAVTSADITLGPNGSDWLSQREGRLLGIDEISAAWLCVKAQAAHKSIGEVIGELVREKIAASM